MTNNKFPRPEIAISNICRIPMRGECCLGSFAITGNKYSLHPSENPPDLLSPGVRGVPQTHGIVISSEADKSNREFTGGWIGVKKGRFGDQLPATNAIPIQIKITPTQCSRVISSFRIKPSSKGQEHSVESLKWYR
jgi:hypothetical protein